MGELHAETRLLDDPEEAGGLLAEGRLVAFPTETVYGLGGAIHFAGTIERIFKAKGRPADNPLIVHLAQASVLERVVLEIPRMASELMEAFWPGPLTLVFRKQAWISPGVTAGLDSVAVRSPANPVARQILQACGCPVAAPSANRSGRPSATTWQSVFEDLNGRIDAIFQGEVCQVGLESTVVDCTGAQPELLRLGAITLEQLCFVRPDTIRLQSKPSNVNSPGLRYKHYQPQARVLLIEDVRQLEGTKSRALLSLTPHEFGHQFGLYRHLPDLGKYAAEVYEFFRQADRLGMETIFCESVPRTGLGEAIMDRLSRAAEND